MLWQNTLYIQPIPGYKQESSMIPLWFGYLAYIYFFGFVKSYTCFTKGALLKTTIQHNAELCAMQKDAQFAAAA